MRLALANLQEIFEIIPVQVSVPILVFALILLIAMCSIALVSRRGSEISSEFVYTAEAPATYRIPRDYVTMEPGQRRVVTIKNLYLNHRWNLERIASLLEVDRAFVQNVLAKSGDLRRMHKA